MAEEDEKSGENSGAKPEDGASGAPPEIIKKLRSQLLPAAIALGAGFSDDYGDDASLDVLRETFSVAKSLFQKISGEFGNPRTLRSVARLHEKALGASRPSASIRVGRNSTVLGDITVTVAVERQQIRESLQQLEDRFVAAWTQFTAQRPVLLVFDTFELVADDQIGQWISSLALRLPNTVTAVSRVPTQQTVRGLNRRTQRLNLTSFTPAETRGFLRLYLGPHTWLDELAAVHRPHARQVPGVRGLGRDGRPRRRDAPAATARGPAARAARHLPGPHAPFPRPAGS